MTCRLILNWKSFAAIGGSAAIIALVQKLTPEQAMAVLNNLVQRFQIVIGGNNDD